MSGDKPYKDEKVLRELYYGRGMTQKEIGEEFNVSKRTISRWMDKLSIETNYEMVSELRDYDWLYEQYIEKEKSTQQIANEIDCTQNSVLRWLEKHDIKTRYGIVEQLRDYDWLYEQYVRKEKSTEIIADELDCSSSTVHDWLKEYNIDTRKSPREKPPNFHTTKSGYERATCQTGEENGCIRLHRLLAVAKFGYEAVIDMDVHHKNKIPWDNRRKNIELMERSEHIKHHNNKKN